LTLDLLASILYITCMSGRKRKRVRRERCEQTVFNFEAGKWGGRRKGAGRKKTENPGVSHLKREEFKERHPVHVTMKILPGLPSLRIKEYFLALLEMFRKAQKENFRIVHFSVQSNHIHLIIEAAGKDALARGMSGLTVRISRGLNKILGREGTVFADRYFSRVLRSPTEVRRVLLYVFNNRRRHAGEGAVEDFDLRSSSMLFDGWKEMEAMELVGPYRPVVPAQSWFVREGWMKAGGKLSLYDMPGPKKRGGKKAES